jgi:alkyl hydroperoxide reductase subunit AhpF
VALISDDDQQELRDAFEGMTRPVRLLFFTQTIGCDTCGRTREILDELPPLSDKITVEEVNLVLEAERAARFGIDRVPAIAVAYEDAGGMADSRIRFLGSPSGYEFVSLVHAILLAGGCGSHLGEESRRLIAAVDRPTTLQVFTTPT